MEDRILHQSDVEAVIEDRIAHALSALPEDSDLTELQIRTIVQGEIANLGGLTEEQIRAIVQEELDGSP